MAYTLDDLFTDLGNIMLTNCENTLNTNEVIVPVGDDFQIVLEDI